jgi:hypothetical protein
MDSNFSNANLDFSNQKFQWCVQLILNFCVLNLSFIIAEYLKWSESVAEFARFRIMDANFCF